MDRKDLTASQLDEVLAGVKIGLLLGPGFISAVAFALALAGCLLSPFIGSDAWNPVIQFLDPDTLSPTVMVTFVLGTILIGSELLGFQLNNPNFVDDAATTRSQLKSLLLAALMIVLVLLAPWDGCPENHTKRFRQNPPENPPTTAKPVEHPQPKANLPRSPPAEVFA